MSKLHETFSHRPHSFYKRVQSPFRPLGTIAFVRRIALLVFVACLVAALFAAPAKAQNSSPPPMILNAQGEVQAQLGVFKGPKVDVLDTDFSGGADPYGVNDSTAAFQAAINYAQSIATSTVPSPVVYIPRGTYKISGPL